MAKIKLDTMLDEVSDKLGNVVYSEWKGVKYVRKYVKAKDACTETQVEIRSAFSRAVSMWRMMPDAVKTGWNSYAGKRPVTGYNLFVQRNFDSVRNGTMLELSRGTGLIAPWNLSATISQAGVLSISFELDPSAGNASVFIQRQGETDRRQLLVSRLDVTGGEMPLVFNGFDPAATYFVYVIATDGNMNESTLISDSVSCEASGMQ